MTREQGNGMRLRVLFDNNELDGRLRTGWGFACLILGFGRTVLFDTGADGEVLLDNMRVLGVDPAAVDAVVLSHIHDDHTGGLDALLRVQREIEVVVPPAFPPGFKRAVREVGARLVEAGGPTPIGEGMTTLGQMGAAIAEQALALETPAGTVVITGCAHPGIAAIAERAAERLQRSQALAIGGFHLFRSGPADIEATVRRLSALPIERVAPCHCTGGPGREALRQAFGDRFLPVGVGAEIDLAALAREAQP